MAKVCRAGDTHAVSLCVREACLPAHFAFGHPAVTFLSEIDCKVYPLIRAFIGPTSPIAGWRVLRSKIIRLWLGRGTPKHPDTVVPTTPSTLLKIFGGIPSAVKL